MHLYPRWTSHRRRRWLGVLPAAVLVAAAIVAPATASFAAPATPRLIHPASSCDSSGQSGGQVAQATVLARAKVWVDENVPYTQNCANLPGGYYREDCSGFISMAWELTSSLITTEFNPKYNGGDSRFRATSRTAMVPGDALVYDASGNPADGLHHHIVLFVGWSASDAGQHRYANIYEESTFGVGTIAETIDLNSSDWNAFTAIHYVNMVASASRNGVAITAAGNDVFFIAPNGQVVHDWGLSDGWHGPAAIGGTARADSPISVNADGSQVVFIDTNGN
ncbi:MAG TPA: hypothetical protein VGJ07_20090, partial [Rugosimonospora sp.]